jgi:hypothetical protein
MGSKIEIAKQIDNAVPPMLAARLADCVLSLFMSKETTHNGQIYKAEAVANYGAYQGTRYVAGKVDT